MESLVKTLSESTKFNVSLDVILDMSLSQQSTALVLSTEFTRTEKNT